jgi:hypothetical protein
MTILNQPCPECFREEDGKWFYPCPSDDCVLHGNREDRAFTHVEESNNNCSFLCNEDGLDIATLHRVRPDEVSDTDHKAACLSDKGWQATVNLVAAAPAMLEALQEIVWLQDTEVYDLQARDSMAALARAAIDEATK